MRFGLFYEHQEPRPWEEGSTERLLNDALDQVELADRVGFDYVWEVEHHFLEEYSHSSAPEVFLAAASQRTERIRLGHGIVQLPPAFNHPVRVVERAATLDLISGGRVDLGTGEASSQVELGGFGVDRNAKRAQWEESIDAVARMFVEEPFAGLDGEHVSIPPRNVMPKPKQKPHPPLWVACSRRETIIMAARRGIGALSFAFIEPEAAKEWVDEYYALIESDECVPAGFDVNADFAVVLPMMLHEDEATAIERGIDGAHFFGYSLAHYYVFGEHVPGRTNIWEEFQRDRSEKGFAREIVSPDDEPLGVKLLQQGMGSLRGAVGTPGQVEELCRRYEAAGVDQVIFVLQAGRNRHEHVCESIELFGERVLPGFAERAGAREAEKAERLAGAVERANARREPPRRAPDGYVITPQSEPAPADAMRAAKQPARPADAVTGGGGVAQRLGRIGEAAFAAMVRGRSEEQLERALGNDVALRLVFGGMERAFVPERAEGFEGAIQYELESQRGTRRWHVEIADGRAVARPGATSDPEVTLRAQVPVFARIFARELNPAQALLAGDLAVEGDFMVAGRIGYMFGEDSPF
ncbi:MAG TPA: LLM class flavin-dependent oxidoreductase [Thermoleophilaceae bacterium]|jgi:alkanesulfonate monooxygenase SsuD/methylene tetrahydromethanopterin reductase-like flavin-dependent oxidoreductase (luciferase family)/putative sterol carrier protein